MTVFAAVFLLGASIVWVHWGDGAPVHTESRVLTVKSGLHRDQEIALDTTIYVPESATARAPAPAVLLAHGFGGTKASVDGSARELAGRGYVVLAWSARGFGRSGGTISLDDPDYEV